MSLPSQSAPWPDPEQQEAWRFEGSVKHAPAFARLKAPPTAGSCCAASLCLPSPPLATPAQASEQRSSAGRAGRAGKAHRSGAAGLSAGSHHRPSHGR